MAKGKKTGGRKAGTPNKSTEIKQMLRAHSRRYYESTIPVEDPQLAELLRVEVGEQVSQFDLDLSKMSPGERAKLEESILRYHTPQMQAVSADLSVDPAAASLELHLADLAADPDPA